MDKFIRYILYFILGLFSVSAFAQQVNTLYFMENVPTRHILNPAFQPKTDFYLSLPIIGYTQFSAGNNSLTLKDVVYRNNDGQTITFLNDDAGINHFYNSLKQTTVLNSNFQTNLLSFGFRSADFFWNFSVSQRFQGMVGLPKDIFQISFYGTSILLNNRFNFKTLQGDLSLYTEVALGFSKIMNENLTLGIKPKFLIGNANLSNTNNSINLDAGIDAWVLKGSGSINESGPVAFNFPEFQSLSYELPASNSDWLKPSGTGAGIDIGLEYLLNERLSFSASLTDLGFIHWFRNARNVNYQTDFHFDGIGELSSSNSIESWEDIYNTLIVRNSLLDSIFIGFNEATQITQSESAYTTGTTSKLNLGLEYELFERKLSLGLLSRTQIFKKTITGEITGSVNAKPFSWLNSSISYSVLNGNLSTFGAGISVNAGIVNLFLSTDYLFFKKVNLPLSTISNSLPENYIPIPYNSKMLNLSLGINFMFNLPERFKPKINKRNGLHNTIGTDDCHCNWN